MSRLCPRGLTAHKGPISRPPTRLPGLRLHLLPAAPTTLNKNPTKYQGRPIRSRPDLASEKGEDREPHAGGSPSRQVPGSCAAHVLITALPSSPAVLRGATPHLLSREKTEALGGTLSQGHLAGKCWEALEPGIHAVSPALSGTASKSFQAVRVAHVAGRKKGRAHLLVFTWPVGLKERMDSLNCSH